MNIPKKYFHDRTVLLLLSVNAFLTLVACAWVLLRLGSTHSSSYIVQYRGDVGIDAFKTGSALDLFNFTIFAVAVLVIHSALSLRMYHIHRQLSVVILSLATVLLILAIIVSNALLVLR